ncbi:MAG: hypothetical protein RLY47_243 [Candidatus Parcubacteria bacterium]
MSRFTKQQLLEGLHKLPQDIQDIVMSQEQSEAFHTIMKKHELTVAQIAAVADTLAPITFGLVLPKELPSELRRALPTLESAKIEALVADVNTLLLAPIRMHVMEAAHDAKTPLVAPAAPTQAPAAVQTPPPAMASVSRTLGADMTQVKMDGTFRLAPDSVTVKAPVTPSVPKPTPSAPVRDGKYAAVDPYREPTN